jgi:accessory gene regulator B
MVEYLSHFLATSLKNEDKQNQMRSYEVLVYGLKIILNTLSVICLTLLLGWAFGWFIDVIITMVSFASLRWFSGGYHIKSSDLCVLISSILMLLITMISKIYEPPFIIYSAISLFSIIVMLLYAPSKKIDRIKQPKKFLLYKIISCLMIILSLVLHSDIVVLTFMVQAITIIIGKR